MIPPLMHRFLLIICLLFSLLSTTLEAKAYPKRKSVEFVIVVPSRNNERWVIKNLESIISQTYPHFTVVYINDSSTDLTGSFVDAFVSAHKLQTKFTVIHNKVRKGAMQNLYEAISKIDPGKVVIDLDGDDRLADPKVLEYLAEIYGEYSPNHPNATWVTYGSFKSDPPGYPNCSHKFPKEVCKKRSFRSHPWQSSHLKTFYAKLFQNIKEEDFKHHGDYFPMTSDLAIMFPILEQASRGHIYFVKKVLCIYNIANPIQDTKMNAQLQQHLERVIRQKPRYPALTTLF